MKKVVLFLIIAIVTFASCDKDPQINDAVIDIDEPTVVPSFTSASIHVTIKFLSQHANDLTSSNLKAKVFYSTTDDFDNYIYPYYDVTNITSGSFVANLSYLNDATKYYYKVEIYNNVSSATFGPYEFTTLSISTPTLAPTTIGNIFYNTAAFSSYISSDGGSDIVEYGFCWSKNANPTLESNIGHSSITNPISLNTTFNYGTTDLTGGATYHVRAYARNSKTVGYGPDASFTTTAYRDPTVITNQISSSDISYTSAKLSGSVTTAGAENVINRGFYYGTSPTITTSTLKVNAGQGTGDFDHTINGLQTGTTYYYCAYAINSAGLEGKGEIKSFTTK